MDTKNPRGLIARASVSIAADTDSPTQKRPILQANRAMRLRLATLLFCQRLEVR